MKESLPQIMGTFLFVLVGIISIANPLDLQALKISSNSDVQVLLSKVYCLMGYLPPNVDSFGFLPAIEQPVPFKETQEMERLYIARYVVTPKVISETQHSQWLIGFFRNRDDGLEQIRAEKLTIVKDCGNGVFLLYR